MDNEISVIIAVSFSGLLIFALFFYGLEFLPRKMHRKHEEARKAYLKAITPSIDYA